MILIECKSIPAIQAPFSVTNARCFIQEEEDAYIIEHKVPILFDDGESIDTTIFMDDYILDFIKKFQVVKVHKTYMDFGDLTYTFHSDSILVTSLPDLTCICTLPRLSGIVTLQVTTSSLCVSDTITIPALYTHPSPSIIINSSFLPDGLCKLYIGETISIETSDKIIYIAPIGQET